LLFLLPVFPIRLFIIDIFIHFCVAMDAPNQGTEYPGLLFRLFHKGSFLYLIYYLPKDIDISISAGNLLGEGCGEGETANRTPDRLLTKRHTTPLV
jgi:hypothetical protein